MSGLFHMLLVLGLLWLGGWIFLLVVIWASPYEEDLWSDESDDKHLPSDKM
jgi:hypothetical protein